MVGKRPVKTPGLATRARAPEERDVFQRLSAGSLLPVGEEFGLSPRVSSVGAKAPRWTLLGRHLAGFSYVD